MKKDPPVRKDGKCSVCGKPRKPERSRKYAQGQADRDPFDDTKCARAFHKVKFPKAPTTSLEPGAQPMAMSHAIHPRELPETLVQGGGA